MIERRLWQYLLGAALAVVASAAIAQAEAGRTEYLGHCASCHGAAGRGDGAYAEFLTRRPTDLTLLARAHGGEFPRQLVHMVIDGRKILSLHGRPDMPIWGTRFLEETRAERAPDNPHAQVRARIGALVDYLESIQQR
jgi:mono/diheme cytochrome c family protein